ncbi:Plasma membrane ATPase [Psidium guajava]|nr:Plasma membrane ATPase [Psidium guajava]
MLAAVPVGSGGSMGVPVFSLLVPCCAWFLPLFSDSKWWKSIRVVCLGTRGKERFERRRAQAFSRTGRAETVIPRFDGADMK